MSSQLPPGKAFPLDYMDKGGLLAMNHPFGTSGAVVYEFRVRGAIDPTHCRQAMDDLVTRFPICRSTIRALDPKREAQTLHYVVHDTYDRDEIFRYVDLGGRGPEALEALRHEIRDEKVDPFQRYPLRLTLARVSPDECWLSFYQHHCTADARGVFALLTEFAGFLRHAEQGTRPTAEELEPYPKRSDFDALGISRMRGILWGFQGFAAWSRRVRANRRDPLVPSFHNVARDYSGGNRSVHRLMDAKVLEEWRALRARHKIGLTAVVAAAQFEANRRWNLELGHTPGKTLISLVAETRPRDGTFRSFANHFGNLFADYDMSAEPDLLDLMLSLNRQLQEQAATEEHKKRMLWERAATARLPLDLMRKAIYEGPPAANLNMSNVIALPLPTLQGRGWLAEDLYITTATMPPYGVLLTMASYNGRLRFNHNYKTTVATREQAESLADHYESALADLIRALA